MKIKRLINKKKTNIILSADMEDPKKVIKLIEQIGEYILGVKLHIDIFKSEDVMELTKKIKELKKKYKLIIIEDRKYSDIGNIVIKQAKRIEEWADIVTAHGIVGDSMIRALKETKLKVLLIITYTFSHKTFLTHP